MKLTEWRTCWVVSTSDSRGLSCDMLATLAFLSLRLSHTHRSHRVFSVTHNWHSLSANSCPLQIGSIICSAGLHKYMHVDNQSSSVNFRTVAHLNTHINTHPHRRMYTDEAGEKTKWWWSDGWMEEAEQVTEIVFSFSLSEVVILSESAISFACLPVFPPEARGEMERFSSDSGRPVLWAKIGLMNKP